MATCQHIHTEVVSTQGIYGPDDIHVTLLCTDCMEELPETPGPVVFDEDFDPFHYVRKEITHEPAAV